MPIRPDLVEPLAAAVATIASARRLVVTCHIGPDGDALGSAIALAAAARARGVEAVATFGGEFTLPEHYDFLDLEVLVPPDEAPDAPDVLVSFDAGSLDRLGDVADIAARAGSVVMIDHHASNTGFGDINVNDPGAGASAQLCFYLLQALEWEITPSIAVALHTGMVTDTGRFQYSNTSPEVLRVAAALVEHGARPEVVGQNIYESVPFGYLGVQGVVLGRTVLEAERGFVWSVLHQADLAAHGIAIDETEPLIDAVRIAREADVAALVKEQPDASTKVSLRSRGRVDVGAIAVAMGGGGHHNAAGFSFAGDAESAIAEVRARLTRAPDGP